MKCPEHDTLLRRALGELPEVESAQVAQHLPRCARCRHEWQELELLLDGVRHGPPPQVTGEAFVDGVVGRVLQNPQVSRAPERRLGWRAWALAASVLLVATAAGVGVKLSGSSDQAFVARGGGIAEEDRLGAELLLLRNDKATEIHSDQLRPTDAFAVRTYNLSARDAYFMAFALDAKGDVHWLFPAWLDATTDPDSVLIPAGTTSRVTTEVASMVEPASGPLLLMTLVTSRPLRVREVEARLSGKTARDPVDGLFEGKMRSWSASWEQGR